MTRRLGAAILLLYPRRIRNRHGGELMALIDDLIQQDGRSRAGLFIRLAVDGLVQRVASVTTAWMLAAVLAGTSLTGLVASDFATASAHESTATTLHKVSNRQLAARQGSDRDCTMIHPSRLTRSCGSGKRR